MGARSIDPLLAARFVAAYDGGWGSKFVAAMAEHFGVSEKTVKRELPRLVEAGFLESETLPARGSPKAYRVSAEVDLSPGFRRGPAHFRRGDRVRLTGLPGLLADRPEEADDLRGFWDAGLLAVCPRCTFFVIATTPGMHHPKFCPVHGSTSETYVDEDGEEEERWVAQPLVWNDNAEPPRRPGKKAREPRRLSRRYSAS